MTSGSSVNEPLRARVGTFQLTPAPKNSPFFVCSVRPRVARVMFSVLDVSGDRLRSTPVSAVPVVARSLDGIDPFNSPTTRRKLRDGNVRPVPHRNAPPGVSKPSGCPRHSYPANPATSTSFAASLLTMPSTAKSALPVLTPASNFPVGTLTSPRTAMAAGFWRNSDQRLIFAPRYRSPTLSPVQY